MIDDSRAARPQAGFNAASLVYQSLADGYESRYMLVFQDEDTGNIGPVRSARFFLVQWAQEVKAALAHYGGDRRTRNYIRAHPVPFTERRRARPRQGGVPPHQVPQGAPQRLHEHQGAAQGRAQARRAP